MDLTGDDADVDSPKRPDPNPNCVDLTEDDYDSPPRQRSPSGLPRNERGRSREDAVDLTMDEKKPRSRQPPDTSEVGSISYALLESLAFEVHDRIILYSIPYSI